MKILTYNAGLLDFRIFGRSILKPADWITERFDHLHSSILKIDPDVVALQEIYDYRHKSILVKQLFDTFPYSMISPFSGPSLVPASLLTLSKWPMQNKRFFRFQDMPIAEKLIDNKGFLLSTIKSPFGDIIIANVHTTAGGTRHPEHPKTDKIRDKQLNQLLARTQEKLPIILVGDFNCGSVSTANYNAIMKSGYTDAWSLLNPNDDGWTWEPTSILNKNGTHSDWGCPAQRIDLVLLNRIATQAYSIDKAEIVFAEESVAIEEDFSVTLSDHYGVLVTLSSVSEG